MKEPSQERVFFVNYRWWKDWKDATFVDIQNTSEELILYHSKLHDTSRTVMSFSASSSSELVFELTKEESYANLLSHESVLQGHHYVLLLEGVWRKILKWYAERKSADSSISSMVSAQEEPAGYPLRLQLIASGEGKITFRISEKDNDGGVYKQASELFNNNAKKVYIWDTTGQTKQAAFSNKSTGFSDIEDQKDEDMLELHFHGMWTENNVSDLQDDYFNGNELALVPLATSVSEPSLAGGSILNRINSRSSSPDLSVSHPLSSPVRIVDGFCNGGDSSSAGLIGLHNLGNTCFMNSAIQCLVHTPKLVEYFLDDYSREINRDNPLGMEGELASAFGELLRKLWAPGSMAVSPRVFKAKLARFAPQFSGYNQHDSQELLAFLLDGLHEDLNRVKHKPYIQAKDSDGRPDDEVAREYWQNHLARNDSIIVDLFQGQFKSTLVCPKCHKISVTFDPFMYLSLPLPSDFTRPLTVTVLSSNGSNPIPYTVAVPKHVKPKDLVQTLSDACSLKNDEKLLLAEIFNHKVFSYFEDPHDLASSIRDDQLIVAYRLPKSQDESVLLEFINCRQDQYYKAHGFGNWKPFGVPLVTKQQGRAFTGGDLRACFLTLISPFLCKNACSKENIEEDSGVEIEMQASNNSANLRDGFTVKSFATNGPEILPNGDSSISSSTGFTFSTFLHDENGAHKEIFIELNETVPISHNYKRLQVFVHWPNKLLEKYDIKQLENLAAESKFGLMSKRPHQETISLYACLEAFLKEEPLGPEDMWYCPGCKDHRQASKKLDLWRLPEILVVHLKRFSYNRFLKNKLETFVNFPTHDLDLKNYVAHNGSLSTIYELFAVSNHYGGMGGGHYTAYAKLKDRWYNFDDSHVSSVTEDRIKTSAAYVLFYRRVQPENCLQRDT